MAQFYTLLTQVGQAKLANAMALGEQISISQLAVGDGGGTLPTPDSNRTALVNEQRRAPINLADIDPDNPNWIVVEQVLPPDVGGWTIREIGVFDSAGDLIAYGNYPETYKPTLDEGSGRTQTVRMVLQVSDTAAVTLRVDPSVVLATRKYVDDGDAAVKAEIAQISYAAGYQFATYDAYRTYTTGEIVRGSDGQFYEFYDRDQVGEVQGVDPIHAANRPHIWMLWDGVAPGSTIEWRSVTLPEGYVENDGSEISRSDYRRIFAALGTTYGAGDGSTTFRLPDDRGEFKRGWDHGRGVDPSRNLSSWQRATLVAGYDDNLANSHSVLYGRTNADYGSDIINISDYPETTLRYATTNNEVDIENRNINRWASATRPRNNATIYLTKI